MLGSASIQREATSLAAATGPAGSVHSGSWLEEDTSAGGGGLASGVPRVQPTASNYDIIPCLLLGPLLGYRPFRVCPTALPGSQHQSRPLHRLHFHIFKRRFSSGGAVPAQQRCLVAITLLHTASRRL